MAATEFRFASADGLGIACRRWDAASPRAVIQIAHGMGEHVGRYAGTIEALVSEGFTVYGNDHRGHGRTARPGGQGDFGQGGFPLLVEDMHSLSRIARREQPGLPLILLGHSMGSFAAQDYVLKHGAVIDGLVLSGSGALDSLATKAMSVPGANPLNARFEPARTPFDWLSRDDAVVDAFVADPLCFAQLQPAALGSFLGAGKRLCSPMDLRAIRADLPVYLFSGSDDPVGQQLDGVRLLMCRYRRAGLCDIAHDFYPGGRHEMLNEINRDEVLERLVAWLDLTLNTRPQPPRSSPCRQTASSPD
jgi:alpha-beta hydrolase superfamily lysophospholipase